MTNEEIIQGLQFTIDMFLSDPLTGEPITKPRNDMDKTTIDACKGAIELLTQEPCEDAISREQAVDAVANLFEMSEYPHPYPQGKPIRLKDIKEKLKQLPSVQPKPIECEDAISRQAAIDEIKSHYRVDNDLLEVIAYKISKLPSVQPNPKTGHWVEYTRVLIPEPINRWEQAWYCSECGYGNQECEDGSAWLEWKYCPNCGARMIEPQESEDT